MALRKILNLNSPGTATTMGGNDYDLLALWHNDVDLTAGAYAGNPYVSRVATTTEVRDNRLRLLNPAGTKSLRVRTLAFTGDYDITIPLIDASDTFLFVDHDANIYNKTISVDDNPITATGISSGDLLKSNGTRFLKMARGLPGQVLTVKDDGLDLEWSDPSTIVTEGTPPPPPSGPVIPDDNSVTTAKIVDLAVTNAKIANLGVTSGKIADNAVITAKIPDLAITNVKLAGSITGSKLVSGTITGTQIASATVTNANLAGSITEDKLNPITDTGKLPTALRYDWSAVKPAALTLTTSNGAEGIWQGHIATTTATGYSNHHTTSTNYRMRWTTAASTNAQAGIRTDFAYTKPQFSNPTNGSALEGKIAWPAAQDNFHFFIGLTSNVAGFPTAGQKISTWGNAISLFGVWIDSPAGTNVRIHTNDGVSTTPGADVSATTTVASGGNHTFKITYDETTPSWTINWNGTDNIFTTDIIPVNTSLGMLAYIETQNATAKEFEIAWMQAMVEPR
jgi:hypothetical protein